MINIFRVTVSRYKISICFAVCLALTVFPSCAQKKSAVEKLVTQKPGGETIKKTGEDKTKEKKTEVEITEKAEIEKDLKQEEKPEEESKIVQLQEEEIEEQDIGETMESISQAISDISGKTKKIEQDTWIELEQEKEFLQDASQNATPVAEGLPISEEEPQEIPQPPVPANIKNEKGVSLNFESTDVKDIIVTFCDLLKIDYILDPGITGKITLQTFKKVKVSELFKILEKILILNNLTVVKTGDFYRFMPIAPAKKESLNIFFGKESELVPERDRLIIQIIQLRHLKPSTARGVLTPLLSKHASFIDVPETNNLMIIDTASNIKRLLDVINIVDVEGTGNQQVELFPLEYSDAEEFALDMKEIFTALGYDAGGPSRTSKTRSIPPSRKKGSKVPPRAPTRAPPRTPAKQLGSMVINFIPIKKLNSLIVINPFPELLPEIEFWISKLDRPFQLFIGKDSNLLPDTNNQVLQIIPLDFITPDSIKGIITPMLTKQGSILASPDSRSLVIIDFVNNIKWVLEIINALDVNTLDKIQVKLIQIEHTDANEVAELLAEIFSSLGKSGGNLASDLKFIPIERLNALIIINPVPGIFPNIESWISRLDVPAMEGHEEKTFIYYVQNTKAGDLASLLTQLYQVDTDTFKKDEKKKSDKKVRTSEPASKKTKKTASKTKPKKTAPKPKKSSVRVKSLQSEEVTGEVIIVPDEFTNSLIIKTIPRNYPAILETIERLDLMPLQVLIEVLVMELTIDESTKVGLDWVARIGDQVDVGSVPTGGSKVTTLGSTLGSATSILQGIPLVIASERIKAVFSAFAQDSKLNVLSNPILITSENMPASISITNDVPIKSTTITSSGTSDFAESSIQYRSVGIVLNITPQINRDRFVNLDISQESSNVSKADESQPEFFTRSTNTNVVVKDKQTLVIGGLMETTQGHTDKGIPLLKDIPLLGYLFKEDSKTLRKTELIIFITPHVIENVAEANQVTKEFRSRLKSLKKEFKLEKQTE